MRIRKSFTLIFALLLGFSPLSPLISVIFAGPYAEQSIEVCFINFDNEENILQTLPGNTAISLNLYTDPISLQEGQVNAYGTTAITIGQTFEQANRDLLGDDGIMDAYCTTQEFTNPTGYEYTYTTATITSNLEWLPIRYND